ncbi:MAG: TIGR00725 family protein [Deltaproteobacteria bacterium]|nr:TIGR00725 family protein [Deltaproteobacteria bacterium]
MGKKRKLQISVIGSSDPDSESMALAAEVGRAIAVNGAILICGGLGGIMQAAARGAKENGGLTIGILPDYDKESANPSIDVAVATGLGHARNILVAASGDLIVALPGSHGTRSEISIALKLGRPVIGVRAWGEIVGVRQVNSIEELKKELVPFF